MSISTTPSRLKELQSGLKNSLFEVLGAASYDELNKEIWQPFLSLEDKKPDLDEKAVFARARAALAEDTDLTQFSRAVQRALQPFEETGLIEKLEHLPEDGSQHWIKVHARSDRRTMFKRVEVKDVRIPEVMADFRRRVGATSLAAAGSRLSTSRIWPPWCSIGVSTRVSPRRSSWTCRRRSASTIASWSRKWR